MSLFKIKISSLVRHVVCMFVTEMKRLTFDMVL